MPASTPKPQKPKSQDSLFKPFEFLEFDSDGLEFGARRGKGEKRSSLFRLKSAVDVGEVVETSGTSGRDSCFYDAIVIGSEIGGLVAAPQLAVKGAKVLVLEKYVIPGGSSGFYERDGFKFDVGSSVMFGFSEKGNLNLITQALAAVGARLEVIPDPTTVHFHLPNGLSVQVDREYNKFISELISKFPHEKEGILKFYGVCWQKPVECLTLAYYLPQNAGDIARKFIKDPELLSFIDAECFIVSTVNGKRTPMINASMVVCDRHFGGINYPVGGVGEIAKSLAKGFMVCFPEIIKERHDGIPSVSFQISVYTCIIFFIIVSYETVDTAAVGKLLKKENLPKEEKRFQEAYVKAPSFLSIHVGIKADVLPPDTDCHHFILEYDDWKNLEIPYGSIFLSIPTVLDKSLAPEGNHILHIFTTSSVEDWEGLSRKDYEEKKERVAGEIINRLEKKLFPGLKSSIVFKELKTQNVIMSVMLPNMAGGDTKDTHIGDIWPLIVAMPRNVPKGLPYWACPSTQRYANQI
ncbi:hypothetical protein SASPL_149928 [Salvia splendens]|uniref:Prolycopene isomerase n=1 Tax=Salvia splendens TaxID=180675 RepID=A0A8X8W594_SALSN|nr:hypothetical protein SASPL_149928 [Salvia splendens]